MSDHFQLLPRILNSAIAGIIASILIYPIDLVKTRFQTQSTEPTGNKTYRSIPHAFTKIYRHEGFLGLYRGLAVNVTFVTPELIVNIAGNDFFRQLLHPGEGKESMTRQIIAAALTGLAATSITSPMEFVKIQLQDEGRSLAESNQTSQSKPKLTARTVIRNVIKNKGILGMYQGVLACAMRDIPFSVLYFPIFALLYDRGPKKGDGEATIGWSLACGFISGSISGVLLTPFDVIKTRMQTLHETGHGTKYTGVWDSARIIYQRDGISAFYRGAFCRLLVIAPLFGITEMIYYFGVAEKLLNLPTQTFVR